MDLAQNVPLSQYSTMRLGGNAHYLLEITDSKVMATAIETAKQNNLPVIMIGDGSNIIWRDEGYPGLVLVNRITGFEVINEDETGTYISVGSGENWDYVVQRSVDMGLSGIEFLSLIPGTAGATPIQNVGAYGKDISQSLVTITAYDSIEQKLVTIAGSDCNFSYRSSRFNTTDKGRFYITAITFMLTKINPMPPFYPALTTYLEDKQITNYTPANIRQAVINIRKSKLPDPKIIPNCGSFFANPIVDRSVFESITENYPSVPHWPQDNGQVKLSAAWLIDQAGFHDYYDKETGMATCATQSLVFINRSAKSTADLINFTNKVRTAITDKFNVSLKQEPLLLP